MKTAVITGSTKGIGRAIALKFLNEGYFVIVNYAHSDAGADEFRQMAACYEGSFAIIKEELSGYEGARSFVAKVKQQIDRVDCLVLNSAKTDRSRFEDITREGWESVIGTNLNAPFYVVQGLSDVMVEQTGSIVLLGSICGQHPHASSLAYAVSKAGIHQMAKDLVKFFAPRGITVNALVPSFVDTPWQKSKPADQYQRIVDKLAAGRFAHPEEVADFCYSIVGNRFITGSVLNIDGGYSYR